MIQRYDITSEDGGIRLREKEDGDFCHYDDVSELEQQRVELIKFIKKVSSESFTLPEEFENILKIYSGE